MVDLERRQGRGYALTISLKSLEVGRLFHSRETLETKVRSKWDVLDIVKLIAKVCKRDALRVTFSHNFLHITETFRAHGAIASVVPPPNRSASGW